MVPYLYHDVHLQVEEQTKYIDSASSHSEPLTSPHNDRCRSRKVTFSDDLTIKSISHKDDYTREEKDQLWVSESDYRVMQAERQRIVRAVIFGRLNPETTTVRGLENILPKSGSQRKEIIATARAAVLKVQSQSKQGGYIDQDSLAAIYDMITRQSKQDAHSRGVADHVEVKDASKRVVDI